MDVSTGDYAYKMADKTLTRAEYLKFRTILDGHIEFLNELALVSKDEGELSKIGAKLTHYKQARKELRDYLFKNYDELKA